MSRVLLVDDDEALLIALGVNLRARDYDVTTASTGAQALAEVTTEPADLVIVDLGLPDIDGVDVVRRLRQHSGVPILVLSARADQADKVTALDAGADDYLTKPFGMDELLARVRAGLRRSPPGSAGTTHVVTATFTLDLAARTVSRGGEAVHLTPTEWHLLEVLVRAAGQLVPHRTLLREVWGPAYEGQTNYLRVYFGQLRRKLELDPAAPRHVITVPGVGYRFQQ